MQKVFQKTIERIETLQESIAKMQFGLRHLMGMNETSIADVSTRVRHEDDEKVENMNEGKKKKKKKQMKEQQKAGDVVDTDKRGKKVIVTPKGETKPLTPAQQREMERN